MQSAFIAISSILALISPLIYAQSIVKGKVKPHRTTRLVLLIITTLATASLFVQGNTVAVWLAGVSMLQSIVIFTLSIKRGMGGWSPIDLLCLAIALIGIILWKTTNNPEVALVASLVADFTGMIPAIIKTYHFPETEDWRFFGLDTLAGLFTIMAVSTRTWQEYAFPLYIFLINTVMVCLILRPQAKFSSKL